MESPIARLSYKNKKPLGRAVVCFSHSILKIKNMNVDTLKLLNLG
jgi:hypothetical protein